MGKSSRKHSSRKPDVEILELKEDRIVFALSKTDLSMVNALRRVIIAETPTLAIDFLDMKVNTSVLNDEFIAHRVGLIPLVSSNEHEFNYGRDCDCADYCEKCSVLFALDVTNNTSENIEVTSNHLINVSPTAKQRQVKPFGGFGDDDEPILLAKLGPGSQLKFSAIAKKGFGKEHAKFQPCSICTFQQESEIQINHSVMDTLNEHQMKKFVESCPYKAFQYDQHGKQVTVEQYTNCTNSCECLSCAKGMGFPDLIKIVPKLNKFIFTVETVGSLPPAEVVVRALGHLSEKIKTLKTAVQTLGEDTMEE